MDICRSNERLSYCRARVEHVFGRSVLGRFLRFTHWTFADVALLRASARLAACFVNLEALVFFGAEGRNTPMNPVWHELMMELTKEATGTLSRYEKLFESEKDKKKRKKKVAEKKAVEKKTRARRQVRFEGPKKVTSGIREHNKRLKEIIKKYSKA